MIKYSSYILFGLLQSLLISVVSGIVCTSDARCKHLLHVASNQEAYCQITLLGVGCCNVRTKLAHWTQWSGWSNCDVTCGPGTRTATRTCQGSGLCHGSSSRSTTCDNTPYYCPVDGYLDDWSAWTACSQTCDWGSRTRSRVCNPPRYGGAPCTGTHRELRPCLDIPCPVNGWVGEWSAWSSCSVTCGDGYMAQTRVCHPPLHGGLPCPNRLSKTKLCNLRSCAVDGVLRDWGSWSHCSATCEGYRKRTRACIPPTNGGTPCTGKTVEGEQCGTQHCPVDGVLRNWEPWVQCSATCEGHRTRTRVCISPKNGGAPCSGSTVEGEQCGAQHCPVDGVLRDWGPWGHCSATCEGQRKRTRACIPPTNGGAPCTGSTTESEQCGAQNCPVDGMLSVWGNWTPCSVTCGSGSRVRSRACIPPQHGGRDCHGLTYEMSKCSTSPCTTPPISTTQPPSTTPSGVSCPTCNALMECTWNTVCDVTESCMVRSFPGFQFTTHCIRKDDCSLLKMLAKSQGEIFCCENKACLHTVLGI
uniref:Brain-specific angiogenesis inhibitor 1-like n=1 Tax=Crassostrea virginica TaxID=6565 RepID=A0A8B8EI92_CRAVI|nr:brain-specific angiogenesis inhibitor 1-like [Crassostrea virginica]